jgi:NADH dehydrogenase FAD-containing subunit
VHGEGAGFVKRVLLLGGGHAHLVAAPLLAAAMKGRASLALVAPSPRLLYSGMMPGWLAGQYDFDECSIDLAGICARHGIEWIRDRVVDIDFASGQAVGENGRHRFDLASVNVGSENDPGRLDDDGGEGGGLAVFGAKPFAEFVERWNAWRAACSARPGPRELLVAGGGAAAVEIAFALARLAGTDDALRGSRVTLATASGELLPGMSRSAARIARGSLAARGVEVRAGLRYCGAGGGAARFEDGSSAPADLVVVATGARPADWLASAARRDSVALAPHGGIAVRSDLRSTSHPSIFAAGDCAGFVDRTVPRSGVHALRQGPVLAANLARILGGADAGEGPLQRYAPRRWTLALLNRCDGSAIGAWGPLGFAGDWAWRWKDRIDRGFIARFPSGLGQV